MKQPATAFDTKLGLFAIPGLAATQKNELSLTDTAWTFAYSVLWNNMIFSRTEIAFSKQYIKEWLKGKNPEKSFLNFCQRIILARLNIKSLNSDFLALPSLWFDPENPEGYAIIKEWLNEIRSIRQSVPGFKLELRALAEAVLEFSESPTRKNLAYWRHFFIERQEPVLLNLFTVFVANHTYHIQ